jgi:hypothetical protein
MTDIFITDFELLAAVRDAKNYSTFRDYEAEDFFIAGMENFAEIRGLQGIILVLNGHTIMLGLYVLFHGEADNEQ